MCGGGEATIDSAYICANIKLMRNTPRDTAESMTAESPLFIYATEMVSLNYVHIDLKHRSVLTLGGSGDQMLNAYFFGAETVTMFDINTDRCFRSICT